MISVRVIKIWNAFVTIWKMKGVRRDCCHPINQSVGLITAQTTSLANIPPIDTASMTTQQRIDALDLHRAHRNKIYPHNLHGCTNSHPPSATATPRPTTTSTMRSPPASPAPYCWPASRSNPNTWREIRRHDELASKCVYERGSPPPRRLPSLPPLKHLLTDRALASRIQRAVFHYGVNNRATRGLDSARGVAADGGHGAAPAAGPAPGTPHPSGDQQAGGRCALLGAVHTAGDGHIDERVQDKAVRGGDGPDDLGRADAPPSTGLRRDDKCLQEQQHLEWCRAGMGSRSRSGLSRVRVSGDRHACV